MKNYQNRNICIFWGILLFIAYSLIFVYVENTGKWDLFRFLGVFSYIQFAYTIISWHKITKGWYDGYIVFTIAFYLFSLGQSFLELIGSVDENFSLILKFGIRPKSYFEGVYLSLSFLLFWHMGALMSYRPTSPNLRSFVGNELNALKKVGLIGICLTFPSYSYNMINNMMIVSTSGYMGLYDVENLQTGMNAIHRAIGDYFVPFLIILLVYSEKTKRWRGLLYSIALITVCIPPFFVGARTNSAIIISIIVLIYILFNRLSIKWAILTFAVAYISLNMLIVVRNIRGDISTTSIYNAFNENSNTSSPISSVVSEMGFTFYPIAKTIEIKNSPHEEFLYGKSFLWSFTTIVPNLNFWDIHPAKKYANMSDWITKKLNFTYGIGYSLIAEAYANFGLFGFVFMFAYGYLLTRLFSASSKYNASKNLISLCVSLIILWFLIRTVRNNFLDTVRYMTFYVLPIYWMLKRIAKNTKSLKRTSASYDYDRLPA